MHLNFQTQQLMHSHWRRHKQVTHSIFNTKS